MYVVCSMLYVLQTGIVPGIAASNRETHLFAGALLSFGAPENNLLDDVICA